MRKLACFLAILVCINSMAFALTDDLQSAIVASADTADLTINVPGDRILRIVNFVQDADTTPRSLIHVTKDGKSADVLSASLVDDRMSAEDKNLRVAGAATVLVRHVAGANVFVTYKIAHE